MPQGRDVAVKRGHWPRALAAAGLAWFGWHRRRGAALDGEVAFVTGGSRGLGFLLAERLLDAVCRVIICARDEQTLRRAHSRLASCGHIDSFACDVSDARDVADLVDHIKLRHGRPTGRTSCENVVHTPKQAPRMQKAAPRSRARGGFPSTCQIITQRA